MEKQINTAERKRLELIEAITTGKVSDPITIGISIGLSVGSSLLQRALSGGSNGKQQVGLMKGTIQLQNSQQGIFIPEIYGAGPEVTLESGTAPSWSSIVNCSTAGSGKITKNAGADQVWNAGAIYDTTVGDDEDAFFQFVVDDSPSTFSASAAGFNTDTTPASGEGVGGSPALEFGVQVGVNVTGEDASHTPIIARVFHAVIQGVHGPSLGTWYPGDVWRVEKRNGAYRLFLNSGEVASFTPPTPSGTLYLAFAGWRTGYGLTSSSVKIGSIGDTPSAGSGGCKVPAMIVWGRKPEKHSYITNEPTHGGKGHSGGQTVDNFFYTIDLRANFARGSGGLQLIREYGNTDILIHDDPNLNAPSGLYNADDGTVGVYDPLQPPDPSVADNFALLKYSGELDPDPGDPTGGGGTGVAQQGASGIAVYPGNNLQSVDATEEAAVDAQNGVNSTTAHRGMAGIVHSALNLQRWQNIPPNITAVWQHKTLKVLGDIYEYLAKRIVDQDNSPLLTSDDYDFSGINSIACRGLLIDGGRYAPAAIIDNQDIQDCYNYFTTEGDGKILAYVNGTEPSITIPIEDFGWLDGAAETNGIFGRLTTSKLDETKFPRQVDLKYVNPGSNWEPDSQSAMRRVTLGNAKNAIQVSLTLNPDEARQAASRNMYRQYVGEPLKFQLSWKYLHLYPGYKITTTDTDSGITYVMRLLSVTGGIGVRDCEAILLETSSFDQSNIGAESPIYNPALPLPSVSILAAMDMPAFRPGEENQFGMYFAVTPRNTDTQSWHGASLFIKRNGTFLKIADFTAPAIMGRIVSVTGTLETDPAITDNTSVITVDLYGSKAVLESVTEADMIAGVNTAAFGDMIGGFATANRLSGWPNRWELSVLRTGQHDTETHTADVLTGRNFALFNSAVKFVPLDITTDISSTIHLKAVSKGASLSDTAELDIAVYGYSIRPVRMTDPLTSVDANDDLLISANAPGLAEEPTECVCEVWTSTDRSDPSDIKRTLPMVTGTTQAALLNGDYSTYVAGSYDPVTGEATPIRLSWALKNNGWGVPFYVVSIQKIRKTFQRFDFSMKNMAPNDGEAGVGTIDFGGDGTVHVALQPVADASLGTGVVNVSHTTAPLSIELVAGVSEVPGTVREIIRSYTTILKTTDNVDVGYGGASIVSHELVEAGRKGPRYTFMVNGNEFVVYRDFKPAGGNVHLVKVSVNPLPSDLRLVAQNYNSSGSGVYGAAIIGTMFGGAIEPSTIYSRREQIQDFGSVQTTYYLRLYQRSTINGVAGVPLDIVVTP